MGSKSVEHSLAAVEEGLIRCEIIYQAILLEKKGENETNITFISTFEPNGWFHFEFAKKIVQRSVPLALLIDLEKGCEITCEIKEKIEKNNGDEVENENIENL
jgi:hypothetical protein